MLNKGLKKKARIQKEITICGKQQDKHAIIKLKPYY